MGGIIINTICTIFFIIFVVVESVGMIVVTINSTKSLKYQKQMLNNNNDIKELQKKYTAILEDCVFLLNENKELKEKLHGK